MLRQFFGVKMYKILVTHFSSELCNWHPINANFFFDYKNSKIIFTHLTALEAAK